MENIHFAAIFEDDFVVELGKSFGCGFGVFVLNEGFPDFGFFED